MYTYVQNNPLAYLDPTGHMPKQLLNEISQQYIDNKLTQQGVVAQVLLKNGLLMGGIKENNLVVFHEMAQVLASKTIYQNLKGLSTDKPVLEYGKGKLEIDIAYKGKMWEVKPFGGDPEPQLQAYYQATGFQRGNILSPTKNVSIFGNLKMSVYFTDEGVINYSLFIKSDKTKNLNVRQAIDYVNAIQAEDGFAGDYFFKGIETGILGGALRGGGFGRVKVPVPALNF